MRATLPPFAVVLGLGVAWPGLGFAQEVSAGASPPVVSAMAFVISDTSNEVAFGKPFEVEVRIEAPPGTALEFPPERQEAEVEVRSLARAASPGAWPTGVHRYEAVAFAIDEAEIPALEIRYVLPNGARGVATTTPLHVRVRSSLPKDEASRRPAADRPPVPVTAGSAFWLTGATLWAIAGLTASLVAAIVLLLLRARRRGSGTDGPQRPAIPADAEALAALTRLAESGLVARGELRAFYIELAFIAKRYLERRLEAPIVEMTSAEAFSWLRDDPRSRELASVVRELTSAADQVKFARAAGVAAEAERQVDMARSLVRTLEARLAPPSEKVTA